MTYLVSALPNSVVRSLDLSFNEIGAESAIGLAETFPCFPLETLNLMDMFNSFLILNTVTNL